jgi:hypothetical protein
VVVAMDWERRGYNGTTFWGKAILVLLMRVRISCNGTLYLRNRSRSTSFDRLGIPGGKEWYHNIASVISITVPGIDTCIERHSMFLVLSHKVS